MRLSSTWLHGLRHVPSWLMALPTKDERRVFGNVSTRTPELYAPIRKLGNLIDANHTWSTADSMTNNHTARCGDMLMIFQMPVPRRWGWIAPPPLDSKSERDGSRNKTTPTH